MDTLLFKENMISLLHVFSKSFFKEKYYISRSFSKKSCQCQCPLYAVILQPATLATLLNFEHNCFSELIWAVPFRQATFSDITKYYRFPE